MAKKKILVIDDESSVRKSFTLALEDVACEVVTASSGEEGLKKAKGKFDVIFCDLKMPGLNGVETVRLLRKKDKKTPIFIVTAFSKEFAEGLKELEKENVEFQLMSKPLPSEQIVAVVEGILTGMASY
jgi:CheY-like chemotaxis protein